MAEAEQTTNPIRLFLLALDIRSSLDKALQNDPENVEVRLDLVRFHAVTPRVAGGDMEKARAQVAEIASRDAAFGHFAKGYLAYREKQYGPARSELREAIKDPRTKAMASRWLGWLSQETQQWTTAFELFESIGDLYEIGRTAAFCQCEKERGRAALEKYIGTKPKNIEQARYQLKKLR